MSSPQVEQMKTELLKRYPSRKWKDKVLKMSDNQIIAIFFRMKQKGEL